MDAEFRLAVQEQLTSGKTVEECLEHFTQFLVRRFHARLVRVLLLDETGSTLWERFSFRDGQNTAEREAQPWLTVNEWEPLRNAIETSQTITLKWDDLSTRALLARVAEQSGLGALPNALLHVPLRICEETIGVLEVGDFQNDPATTVIDDTGRSLLSIAPDLAVHMDRLRLQEAAVHRHDLFQQLESASLDFQWDMGEDQLRHETVRRAVDMVGWDCGGMYKRMVNGDLQLVKVWKIDPLPAETTLPEGQGVIRLAFAEQQPQISNPYASDATRELRSIDGMKLAVVAAVPLQVDDSVDSILFIGNRTPRRFLRTEIEVLVRLATRSVLKLQTACVTQKPYAPLMDRLIRMLNDLHQAPDEERLFNRLLTAVTAAYGLRMNRAQLFLVDAGRQNLLGRAAIGQFDPDRAHEIWEQAERTGKNQFSCYNTIRDQPCPPSDFNDWTRSLLWALTPESAGSFHEVISSGKIVVVDPGALDSVPVAYAKRMGGSVPIILVPLYCHSEPHPIGVLVADNAITRLGIENSDLPLLSVVADSAAAALVKLERVTTSDRIAEILRKGLPVQPTLPPREALRETTRQIVLTLGASWAKLILFESHPDNDDPPQVVDIIKAGHHAILEHKTVCRKNGVSYRVLDSRQARYIDNVHAQPDLNPSIYQLDTSAAACVPFVVGPQVRGVVWIHYTNIRRFTTPERSTIEFLVGQAANIYGAAVAIDDKRRLQAAAQELAATTDLKEIPNVVVQAAASVMDAPVSVFWPCDRRGFVNEGVAAHGVPVQWARNTRPRENGTSHRVLTQKYLAIVDTDKEAPDIAVGIGVRSFQAILLEAQDQPLGVLYVSYYERRQFDSGDKHRLQEFAELAAHALHAGHTIYQSTREIEVAEQVAVYLARHVTGAVGQKRSGIRETLGLIAATVQNVSACDSVTVWSYTHETDTFLTPPTGVGVTYPERMGELQPRPESIIRMILAEGEQVADSIETFPAFASTRFAQDEGIRSCLAMQLVADSGPVGVMFVNFKQRTQFPEAVLRLIRRFARQAAVVIRNAQLMQEKAAELEQKQQLVDLSINLLRTTNEQDVLDSAVALAQRMLGTDISHIVMGTDGCQDLTLVAATGWNHDCIGHSIPPASYAGLVIQKKERINIANVHTRNKPIEVPNVGKAEEIQSVLAVPMRRNDDVIGALLVCDRKPRVFSSGEARFLELVAHLTALAVQGTREFHYSRRQIDAWKSVFEAAKAITGNAARDRAELVSSVLEYAVKLMRHGRELGKVVASIQKIEDDELIFEALYPEERADLKGHRGERRRLVPNSRAGITGLVALDGKAQIVNDVEQHLQYLPLTTDIHSELAVPMLAGGKPVGVLNIECEARAAFTEIDRMLLQTLADLAVLALQRTEVTASFLRALGSVAHELRTPLGTLNMSLATWKVDDRVFPEQLEYIRHQVVDVDRILTNVADQSRILQGQMQFGFAPTNMTEVVNDAIGRVFRTAAVRSVGIRPRLEDITAARADADKLGLVVQNLLSNAIKFSPEGEDVDVVLSADGDTALLLISDRGPGIPPEERDAVFREFYQSPRIPGSLASGLGIGLSLCREFVHMHRGRIWVQDAPGPGTTMAVRLPLV